MKLASLKSGRDGQLVVVSRDLSRAVAVTDIAATMQQALDDWADRLRGLESEQPLFFHRLEDFGEDRRLKTEVEPGTPAQHRSPRKHLP